MPFVLQSITLTPLSPQAQGTNYPLFADTPLVIRDTNTHYSAVLATNGAKRVTIIVDDDLDQAQTLAIFGSKDSLVGAIANPLDPSGPLVNGYAITAGARYYASLSVAAYSTGPTNFFVAELGDYHPFIQLSIKAGTKPTTGTLSIFALMEVGET